MLKLNYMQAITIVSDTFMLTRISITKDGNLHSLSQNILR